MEGSHEFAGMTVPTSMFVDLDRTGRDETESARQRHPSRLGGHLVEGRLRDPTVDVARIAEEDVADVAVRGKHVDDRRDRDLEAWIEGVGVAGQPDVLPRPVGGKPGLDVERAAHATALKPAWSTHAALVTPRERPTASAPTPTRAVIRRPVARNSVRPSAM